MALKHTPPSAHAPITTTPYEPIIQDVLAQARHLMERVGEAARTSLQSKQDQARTPGEHQAMLDARQQLMRLVSVMSDRYPDALRKAIDQEMAPSDHKPTRALFTVHFDDLELMDESQINDSVERARARQVLISAVEAPLADLDALVCAALGLPRVQPEHNPLRPDLFLQALQTVVSQMQVSEQVRHDWMAHMAQSLGAELRGLYVSLIDRLKQNGLQPVGYAMRQATGDYVYVAPMEGGVSPGFASDTDLPTADRSSASGSADSLLTLDRLRRLLLGEFSEKTAQAQAQAPSSSPSVPPAQQPESEENFADRFAREFESADPLPHIDPPATDFAATVPAAFEALQEMQQVGQMMERLGNQRLQVGTGADGRPAAPTRKHAAGLGEALSVEVVALMVDNMARDNRLLWPVQQFVRALEPALMQLAVADPRFFSHKDHAARRLLQDITDRSLAFAHPEAPGFQSFMRSLMNIAGPLASATIEGADDFEQVLQQLHAKWEDKDQDRKQERQRAIETLQHAEQRHLLAAKIADDLRLQPDIGKVPDEIARFLLGPWTQVMAQARLTNTTGRADPGHYEELVGVLIWSTQPALTRANPGELARLVPKLLVKLREGLASIDYPAARTDAVFDLLMQLHEQAFKPDPNAVEQLEPQAAPEQLMQPVQDVHPAEAEAEYESEPESAAKASLLHDEDPWVAPSEAKESGFMDVSESPEPERPAPVPEPATIATVIAPATRHSLNVGIWVNLLVSGEWERTQLSWIGSRGNLFLFTSASGRTQSMTLRLLDRLLQQGALQILTEQNVVDGALDAVAQVAMHNSVERRL